MGALASSWYPFAQRHWGFYFGAITVLYGITLGLLLIGVWSTFTETEAKVDREASTLASLFLDVSHYPEPGRGRLQDDVRSYTRALMWLGLSQWATSGPLPKLANDLAAFEPASEGQKALHAEVYRQFNKLVERRRSWVLVVTAGLSGSLWALVLLGAAITIAVTWCFHLHNQRMHFCITGMTSTLLGLLIFLLAAMDHPYLGGLSVSPQPYQLVY